MTVKTKTANPSRNEVVIELDTKKIKLRGTFDAICKIEEAFDASLFEIVNLLDGGKIKTAKVVQIIMIGAEAAEEDITEAEVQDAVMSLGTVKAIGAIVPYLAQLFSGNAQKKV